MALQFRRVSGDPHAALEIRRGDAEQRRADRQVAAELRRMEIEQQRADQATDRAARDQQRRASSAHRAAVRAARKAALHRVVGGLGRRAVFVGPLLLITSFAVFGQIGYGMDHYTSPEAEFIYKVVVATGAAIAIESISNYVQWLSHRARLAGASAMAARLARWSYAIAFVVAGINYAHFCGPGGAPTPGAVVFAAFSLSSPWLWGLYTRGAEHEKRAAEGTLDCRGAVFATERWRQFPILTWKARRYSILRNISDPAQAWNAFLAEHQRIVAARRIQRRQAAARRSADRSARRAARSDRRAGRAPDRRDVAARGPATGPDHGPNDRSDQGQAGGRAGGLDHGPADGPARGPALGWSETTGPAVLTVGAPRATVSLLPRAGGELTQAEQASLRELATHWAASQDEVPGWRKILGATDDAGRELFPGISHPSAKTAARQARERRGLHTDEAAAQ